VLSMYAAAAALWGIGAGLSAALIYAVAPIRLEPAYWHGLGTALAMLFVPLVVMSLGLLFRGIRDLVGEAERPERLERRTRAIARPGALVSDRTLARLQAREQALRARLGRLFDDHDVLLTPVMSRPAVRAGIMEGRGATMTYMWETGWVPFNVLWNSTGQPSMSVPAGFGDDELPLAAQIVGRPHAEATLLSLAAQIEAARPWADRRPPEAP